MTYSMKETKEIVKSIVWSCTFVYTMSAKLEYSFNEVLKLSRLTTAAQHFKSTEFSVISLKIQCLRIYY